MAHRTVGVEEELLLVDPGTRRLTAVAGRAVGAHDEGENAPEVDHELFLQQLETATPPCRAAEELREELRRGRRAVGKAAAAAGAHAVAMPTPVLVDPQERFTPKARYLQIRQEYGELAREALVCAMHVHVEVADDEEGVAVIDRVRPWLPVLLALSANSPYWRGMDTGHASWRSQVWGRWPSAGPQQPFGDVATYRRSAEQLVQWGASLDVAALYFDVRLAESFPTVEVRVADVCTDLDDAVLVTLLVRALVETSARDWQAGGAVPAYRADLLRGAGWRAARSGLAGPVVHPAHGELSPVRAVVEALVDHVRPALEETGDLGTVRDLFERVVARGGGAARQRSAFEAHGELTAVVDDLVRRTEESWS